MYAEFTVTLTVWQTTNYTILLGRKIKVGSMGRVKFLNVWHFPLMVGSVDEANGISNPGYFH